MNPLNLSAYAISIVVLTLKFASVVSLQGLTRLRTKTFQYPEDAAYFGGTAPEQEQEIVRRAQRLLRNDGEGQPLYLALGAALVALNAAPSLFLVYCAGYPLSRLAHAWYFLRPRQPQRNRAFAAGLLILLAMATHVTVAATELVSGSAAGP